MSCQKDGKSELFVFLLASLLSLRPLLKIAHPHPLPFHMKSKLTILVGYLELQHLVQ